MVILMIGYIIGMGIFNVSRGEYSGVRLSALSRYMNICFMGVWIYLLLAFIYKLSLWNGLFESENNKKRILIVSLVPVVMIVLLVDVNAVFRYISRKPVEESIKNREQYEQLTSLIKNECTISDKIYFVSRGKTGEDSSAHGGYYNVIKFNIEPIAITVDKRNQWDGWGLGPPLSDNDIWYLDISPAEWMNVLNENNYSYVAIFRASDDLYDNYGELFENQEAIQSDSLYRIDYERRKLERVIN